MTPLHHIRSVVTCQIVPDQNQADRRPTLEFCLLLGIPPITPATPPLARSLRIKGRQTLQNRHQLRLEPGMQNGIGSAFDRCSTHRSGDRMKQGEELGGSSTNILMRSCVGFPLGLPGRSRLGNGLVGTGFVLGPGRNAGFLRLYIRLLDQPLFKAVSGSQTVTMPSLRTRWTTPVKHQVRSCCQV